MGFEGEERPRKFDKGVVYIAPELPQWDPSEERERLFVIVGSVDLWWDDWSGPVTYRALDLLNGEEFAFHKHSVIAEKAKPL